MWFYEKQLQYPVKIKNPNPKLASVIISQLGGPDGELGASMRYLHQRYSCPFDKVTGILTDVGSEELGHMEMIAAIIHQLTKNLTLEQIDGTPFAAYFVDHTTSAYPVAASGVPFDMKYVGVKGDILTDLNEDLAADAAIIKEQLCGKRAESPCKIRLFRTLAKHSKIAYLLSHKSNNRNLTQKIN